MAVTPEWCGAVAGTMLVLAGCTAAGGSGAGEGDALASATAGPGRGPAKVAQARMERPYDLAGAMLDRLEPLWTSYGEFGGPVAIHDGTVVAVDHLGDPDVLKGIDLETGEVRWRRASSRGALVGARERDLTSFETSEGDTVVLSVGPAERESADGGSGHTGAILDPATGEILAELPRAWMSQSWACPGVGGLCLGISTDLTRTWSTVRIDPATLAAEPFDESGIHAGVAEARVLAGGVQAEIADDGVEALVRRDDDGRVLWRLPVDDLEPDGSVLGSLAAATVREDPAGDVLHLSTSLGVDPDATDRVEVRDFTALSLDLATGEVLARRDGRLWCHAEVLCSGDLALVAERGGEWVQDPGDLVIAGAGARASDLAWEAELPAAVLHSREGGHGYASPPGTLLAESAGVVGAIDLETGAFTALGEGTVACTQARWSADAEYASLSGDREPVRSGLMARPCRGATAGGSAAGSADAGDAVWSRAAIEGAATVGEVEGRRIGVVVEEGQLAAYDLTEHG